MAELELSKSKYKKDSIKEIKDGETNDENESKNKRKREEDDAKVNGETKPTTEESISDNDEDKKSKKKISSLSKEERKAKKAKKKAEKEELLAKVPKTDEHGIAYTKIQTKRMVKRAKRGLNPVPTEQEEYERMRMIKKEKAEEEMELAGMLHQREDEDLDGGGGDENDGEQSNEDSDVEGGEEEEEEEENEIDGDKNKLTKNTEERPKKKARSKPVPSDYTCMACKNKHQPLHWIYDCPDKIRKPGTNQLKKKQRGIHDPASRKVFISGLPFEAKAKEVEMYFEKEMKCGKVVYCKLLQFEDTKRCKGTGFLTFETDEGAQNALKLNDTVLTWPESHDIKDTSKGEKKQKELKLGVKKLMNRTVTKQSRS
jgi:hypothetical protein